MSSLILSERNTNTQFNLNNRLSDSTDYFLVEISGKIQLTETQRLKAEGHYGAIANVLRASPENTLLNKLDIKMIPFGGFGSNTASKPFQGDEFDLDLIVRFFTTMKRFGSAENLYNEVWKTLHANEVYKNKIEKKDRCIRVYYAGDFYLDLMSAVLTSQFEESTKLIVPEKQKDGTYEIELVDPIGLINWFDVRCGLQRHFVKNSLSERGEFEVMPLITQDATKSILKQAVQLLKRGRDVYFCDDKDAKKILKSVVILTVAGHVYTGSNNLHKLLSQIIDKIDELTYNFSSMKLENPVNTNENFFESLSQKRDRYDKLRGFIKEFKSALANLTQSGADLNFRKKQLAKLFGETVATTVLSEYAEKMHNVNLDGKMRMNSTGLVSASASAIASSVSSQKIPRHQFFGDK